MTDRLPRWIRIPAVLSLSFLLAGVAARRVSAQEASSGEATLRGVVVDGVSSQPIVGAAVGPANGRYRTFTDAHGRFVLRGLPAGPVEITVEQLGYEPWSETRTLAGGAVSDTRIALHPDPMILPRIAVYADRFRARRNALATSVRAWDAAAIATSPAFTMMEFVEEHAVTPLRCPASFIATQCILRRGRVIAPSIYVNDIRYPSGLETLQNFDTGDTWLVEVLGQGAQIRIYTKAYAERLALGEERMMPVIF